MTYIAICCLVFVLQLVDGLGADSQIIRTFGLQPDMLSGHQPQGLLTYMFLHGSIGHIFGNLLLLWVLGDNTECELGPLTFITLCIGSSVVGGLAQLLFGNTQLPVVGASGAIAGIMGAYCVLFPKVKLRFLILLFPIYVPAYAFVLLWGGVNIFNLGLGSDGVAWWAHVGGLFTGVCIAFPLRRKPFDQIMATRIQDRYQR